MDIENILNSLIERYPVLASCKDDIYSAYEILADCYRKDGFVFTCGNGGSASDADHIVGELMKGFILKRPLSEDEKDKILSVGQPEGSLLAKNLQNGFRAMSLMNQTAIYTAAGNDLGGDTCVAQQLNSLGREGDVLWGISTSGNATNIAMACQVARLRKMKIIGMTGIGGGRLAGLADICIKVPVKETFKVQELHLPVYHALCIMLEKTFFKE